MQISSTLHFLCEPFLPVSLPFFVFKFARWLSIIKRCIEWNINPREKEHFNYGQKQIIDNALAVDKATEFEGEKQHVWLSSDGRPRRYWEENRREQMNNVRKFIDIVLAWYMHNSLYIRRLHCSSAIIPSPQFIYLNLMMFYYLCVAYAKQTGG